jgi:hypothetical protein
MPEVKACEESRYSEAELESAMTPIRERPTALEDENARLRAQLADTP